jgi:hypothetical protein
MTLVDIGAKQRWRIRGGGAVIYRKSPPSSRQIAVRSVQQIPAEAKGAAVTWTAVAGSLATCVITTTASLAAPQPAAHAKNGDTHVIGEGSEQTLDCNDATLIVNSTRNTVNALGNCWAVTVMGSSNTVIADSVTRDITVYGYDQTVFYHNGAPIIWDHSRELGMTNRLQQVPGSGTVSATVIQKARGIEE